MELQKKTTNEYRGVKPEEAAALLGSGAGGLSEAEARERLLRFGPNAVAEKKRSPVLNFLKRYWGPMPWLLEFAMVLTFVLKHYTETALIFTLLTVNAVIGFLQSRNSQKAVELLKTRLQVRSKVLRGGRWVLTDAKELVPGDVLGLKLGDLIPADVLVTEGELSVDASALTGESLPQDAGISDVAYSGSIVKRGEGRCLVVGTGADTYFGKTVSLVQTAKPKSKQQALMLSIVKYMMYLGVAASAVVSCYAAFLHRDLLSILSLITVFLIGAIPVALPAVLTIVQAVGALDLSKKGVLVTRLDSVEDAASIDTFCFDKTGTITQNKLAVTECRAFGPGGEEHAVLLAALASKAEEMDAIDTAVLAYAEQKKTDFTGCRRISYTPFTPADKRTEAEAETAGERVRIIKGEPQTILKLCGGMNEELRREAEGAVGIFSAKGCRTIAVAEKRAGKEGPFTLAALLALSDPPRPDSAGLIRNIRELGIRCLMLTGDNREIAREVAGQVGIGTRVRRAGELAGLSDEEQAELVGGCDGFAEVYPEDKYKIVRLLQEGGHTVGMTGDGVNDSPALKQAELGTAVASATDVAKASASIVLTKPGLGEIVDTIRVSRRTYQRMLTWVINKVTKVVEVTVLFSVGYFWLHDMVITLLGMSLLVFANDFATMSIATDNAVSTKSPNSWNLRNIVSSSVLLGTLFALEDLFLVYLGLARFHLSFGALCTLVMLSLVFNTQFRILIVRERRHFWSSVPGKTLLFVNLATIAGFFLLGVFGAEILPVLTFGQVAVLLGVSALSAVLIDFVKVGLFRVFRV